MPPLSSELIGEALERQRDALLRRIQLEAVLLRRRG